MSGALVELRVGVVGGFAPAVLKLHITISEDGQVVREQLRAGVKSFHPNPADYERFHGKASADQLGSVLSAIGAIWALPTENPPGSEDIYRIDTSIHFRQSGREWVNLSPAGCVHAQSASEATKEQRAQFKSIAEAIQNFANQVATTPA